MNAAQLFRRWKPVRRGLVDALDKLSDEQLRFVPGEGLWSLGTVACHIANAEEGWFRYVVTRELGEWPPLDEERYSTIASVKALLDQCISAPRAIWPHWRLPTLSGRLSHHGVRNSHCSELCSMCWNTKFTTGVRSISCWG